MIGSMKKLQYYFCGLVKEIPWSEVNEAIAKKEADNGEYTVEDDGTEETSESTLNDRVQTLEKTSVEMSEALELILSGVTE